MVTPLPVDMLKHRPDVSAVVVELLDGEVKKPRNDGAAGAECLKILLRLLQIGAALFDDIVCLLAQILFFRNLRGLVGGGRGGGRGRPRHVDELKLLERRGLEGVDPYSWNPRCR